MGDFTPLTTGLSRVFIVEGRARPDHQPDYQSCMRAQAVAKGFGDVTDIECPDPHRPGQYVKIGQYQGAEDRAKVTLEGRLAMELRSELLRLGRKRCAIDVQLHFGNCQDLSAFNDFKKILFLEDVLIGAYNTDDLGSLASGDTKEVNENVDLSARNVYDIVGLSFAAKADDLVTNEVLDVAICDQISCGDCGDESSGCQKAYTITKAAGGSPSTPPDLVFTLNGGVTWYAHDIDCLSSAQDPSAVDCIGDYIVVVSNAACKHCYTSRTALLPGVDPVWTAVTGYTAPGCPNDLSSFGNGAFVVGDWGYIYLITDPTAAPVVQSAGVLTTSNFNRVSALSEDFAVAVGNSGVIAFTDDGVTWALSPTTPFGVGVNLLAVLAKTTKEWWVGTSTGRLFYTLNAGITWTEKTFPGSGSGTVYDIVMATDSIMYLAHTTAAGVGRILVSFDGGYSWIVLPQDSSIMPANQKIARLAACQADPGLLIGVGLGAGTDGKILVGTM